MKDLDDAAVCVYIFFFLSFLLRFVLFLGLVRCSVFFLPVDELGLDKDIRSYVFRMHNRADVRLIVSNEGKGVYESEW